MPRPRCGRSCLILRARHGRPGWPPVGVRACAIVFLAGLCCRRTHVHACQHVCVRLRCTSTQRKWSCTMYGALKLVP